MTMKHGTLLIRHVSSMWALIILLPAGAVHIQAQPLANTETVSSVTCVFEVGGGETEKTARILRKLIGARAVGEATPPVTIGSEDTRLLFIGPVEDASRVESYLKLAPPRLPRLVELRHTHPSDVARSIEAATEESGEQKLVVFPDDRMESLYLIASSVNDLDIGEAQVLQRDRKYPEETALSGQGREGRSWTDYVKIGGDIRFDTTWYRGLGGQDYNSNRTRARVDVEVGGENVKGRVGVRGEESSSR